MDRYRSNLSTIKLLLKTYAIPFIIVDYNKNYITVAFTRDNTHIMCHLEMLEYGTELKLLQIFEDELDDVIINATKLNVDFNVILPEVYNELITHVKEAYDIYRSRSIELDEKNQRFTDSDFTTLIRLANKYRLDVDSRETD